MSYPHWLLLPIGISDYKYFRDEFNTGLRSRGREFDPGPVPYFRGN